MIRLIILFLLAFIFLIILTFLIACVIIGGMFDEENKNKK